MKKTHLPSFSEKFWDTKFFMRPPAVPINLALPLKSEKYFSFINFFLSFRFIGPRIHFGSKFGQIVEVFT